VQAADGVNTQDSSTKHCDCACIVYIVYRMIELSYLYYHKLKPCNG